MLVAALDTDLGDALADLAGALRVPVLLLAILALVACALEVGRFVAEAWRRRGAQGGVALRESVRRAISEPAQTSVLAAGAPSALAGEVLSDLATAARAQDRAGVEHALADFELAAQRRLDRTRILVRAGPAIGLMGTLIPLAPGLSALGRGDVASLAQDLRTAFGATVIGLLVGTVAFALTLSRTRMYTEDLAALERASEAGRAGTGS